MENNQIIELHSSDYTTDYKKEGILNNIGSILPLAIIVLLLTGSTGKGKIFANPNTPYKSIPANNLFSTRKGDHEILHKSEHMVDKLSNALELMKKINKLNEIKSLTSGGQGNLDGIHEAFSIFKNIFSDNANIEKLETLENTISTVKKFGEIKKLLDFQKTLSSFKQNDSSVSNMMSAISPLLSDENGDNMKNMEKILRIANLISTVNPKE